MGITGKSGVKIMSFYKVIIALLFILFVIVVGYILFFTRGASGKFNVDCASNFYISFGKGEADTKKTDMPSVIRVALHISSSGDGAITEYGFINYNGNRYILNRVVSLRIFHENSSHYVMTREKIAINAGDSLPSSIYDLFSPKNERLYYDIRNDNNGMIFIRNAKRVVFVCHSD